MEGRRIGIGLCQTRFPKAQPEGNVLPGKEREYARIRYDAKNAQAGMRLDQGYKPGIVRLLAKLRSRQIVSLGGVRI